MKTNSLIVFFLALTLIFVPFCQAGVVDVIMAPVKVVEGSLWIAAIACVVSVGIVGVPGYYLNKIEEKVRGY